MHDHTLTNYNRDKLIQIAERYGQPLKFYNVEELCADKLAEIEDYFPQAKESQFSIATFYRFFIPYLLLSQGIEKVIYLDSDIIVNLDIAEFYQIELGDKPFAAVPNLFQMKDEKSSYDRTNKAVPICKEGVIKPEDYFNAGVLLMNLKFLRNEKANILAGVKFISENPQFPYLDQDILNYCFSTTYLKLSTKFNRYVMFARSENEWAIEKKIYHYAALKFYLGLDANDPYSRLFMDYFIKTSWVDDSTANALSGASFPSRKNYSVSVVIPMYNMAEYVGECLDSLLAQTFQDFEVIVVDDCSTDNSVEIVKSYMPKFNGRLKLTKTETNSGSDCPPRNIGLLLARGEYLQFIDADDMLLTTALETLYKAAILYDAEVVYTAAYYRLNAPNDIYLCKDGMDRKLHGIKIEFTIDDPSTNLSRLLFEPGEGNFRACWTKFVRRDFLLENQILFPNLTIAGDFAGVIDIYCHARRFLRISTSLYVYRRYNTNSMTRTARSAQEQCWHWFSAFVNFAKCLHELEKKNKILAENPLYSLMALKGHLGFCLYRTGEARKELGNEELHKILHSEFAKISPDSAVLLSFLFSFINEKEASLVKEKEATAYYVKTFNKLRHYFTAKIYVLINKKMDKETIQILSVSDEKAVFSKPEWWQRNGTCHIIDSYTGKVEIVAKAVVGGQVKIRLGGQYVQNPEDKTKRLPYWIDYTKLTINGKVIFDTLTPAWHDKAYEYTMNAKAGEDLKINIEWQPHRADTIEPKVVTPPPVKVESSIPDSFKPFITARIDAKLLSTAGDFQIVSVSDKRARVQKSGWLQEKGIGYQINSYAGKLDFIARATVDGQISLLLRGIDIRDPEDKSKRIPYWIDYTNFTINGKKIFDTLTPVWHDKPYKYTINVKADEEITIQAEWLPHRVDTVEQKIAPPPQPKSIPNKFVPFITARIDVKLMTTEGDFQIVSISDKEASVKKPSWLQNDGIGYMIQSYVGELKIVAKPTTDGQIKLNLKGIDVRDPEDKSKRIPYWIDYTNFTINGKKIFDTLTPVWHDKPYKYTINVKADEEITIQAEWLPHRSET